MKEKLGNVRNVLEKESAKGRRRVWELRSTGKTAKLLDRGFCGHTGQKRHALSETIWGRRLGGLAKFQR